MMAATEGYTSDLLQIEQIWSQDNDFNLNNISDVYITGYFKVIILFLYIVICILILGYSIITSPKLIRKYIIDYRIHDIINMNDATLKSSIQYR